MSAKQPAVLKRVRFSFEALCEVDVNTDELELPTVLQACYDGDMSGRCLKHETTLLNHKQALLACEQHGTDREFFGLATFKVGTRVWWTDPDKGSSSGWYTIKAWTGELYEMINGAGGECEALDHELSLTKPKRKKT